MRNIRIVPHRGAGGVRCSAARSGAVGLARGAGGATGTPINIDGPLLLAFAAHLHGWCRDMPARKEARVDRSSRSPREGKVKARGSAGGAMHPPGRLCDHTQPGASGAGRAAGLCRAGAARGGGARSRMVAQLRLRGAHGAGRRRIGCQPGHRHRRGASPPGDAQTRTRAHPCSAAGFRRLPIAPVYAPRTAAPARPAMPQRHAQRQLRDRSWDATSRPALAEFSLRATRFAFRRCA